MRRTRKTPALFWILVACVSLAVFSVTAAASDDSACISCHTNPGLMDEMTPVVVKESAGG